MSGLKRDDFEVLVGGVAQKLATASFVRERIILVFVDDLHLDFNNTGRLRALLRRLSEQLARDGDLVAMVSDGPSEVAIDPTYDRKRLDEAITRISGAGMKPNEIIEAPLGADGPPEVKYRMHIALASACESVQRLAEYRGRRKALVYVSNGYDVPLGTPGGSDGSSPLTPSCPAKGDPRFGFVLQENFAALVRAARRTNTTVHTFDTGAILGNQDGPDPRLDQADRDRRLAALHQLSQATGGVTVTRERDLVAAIQQISATASGYYLLEYYWSRPVPLSLEIKVRRPGVVVATGTR